MPAALHLCKLGYTYLDNINAYDTKTNILIDVFLNAVKHKRMYEYKTTLKAQFEESHRLEKEILAQLRSMSFNNIDKEEHYERNNQGKQHVIAKWICTMA